MICVGFVAGPNCVCLPQVRFDVYDIDDDKAVEYVKDLSLETTNKCGSTHPTLVNEVVNAFTPKCDPGLHFSNVHPACLTSKHRKCHVNPNATSTLQVKSHALICRSGDAGSKLLLFGDACEKQNIHNATVTLNGSVRLAITGDGKATEDVAFTHEEEARGAPRRDAPYFTYKTLHNKDTFHIKH